MSECNIPPLVSDDPRVSIGRYTYGNATFKLWLEEESVRIGSFCSIADDVLIFGGGEHRPDWVTTYPLRIAFGDPLAGLDGHPATKGPTVIGNDVWIGHGARILSGVVIGDGACIGAGAVVTKPVPAYAVVAGNPAEVKRLRFSPPQVEQLLRIRWWDWPIEAIRDHTPLLCSSDIDAFIAQANAACLVDQDRSR
ncbi:acetyltransferase-like isoleucine patch superfamily enzyme [Lysobacter niastensis]|uniref:Acetyltransferase-like isoleucine patch superfamily enzyme n=1 Tax=Lysobacter niastensis TaxID=380629 RepID=A0ABU1WC67_9GAMM|nr:CatB-related O-acetyltransferase [Lysobacter niastensis]MDR7135224.1 acetyltransferase-like isoleucine patch superfamily enzyme [Lysobacter niastensis]